MLQMFANSVRLFFKGKLFRDNGAVLKQWAKGFALTLAVLLVLGFTVNPLTGVIVASLLGGALQPVFFKDLKYS
jgi:hypothetical protein